MKNKSKILVIGGCGYIGSHVVRQLSEAGEEVLVIDNLSTGFEDALLHGEKLFRGDFGDEGLLESVFGQNKISAVLHFAASIRVDESVEKPLEYYHNNSIKFFTLIKHIHKRSIPHFILSSTAAVYGEGSSDHPFDEDTVTQPISPYGRSKRFDEWLLEDVCAVSSTRYIALRYFNVAGASSDGRLGQRGDQHQHLIKVASRVAVGKRSALSVFGTDYPTHDGTCVRDYIHIEDLAAAHLAALRHLESGGRSRIFNCGYGKGYSVREVVEGFSRVLGRELPIITSPRRAGDPASLIADNRRLLSELNWKPTHDDIDDIIRSAYEWEKRTS